MGDEDVTGLQIPVNHQTLVSVSNRVDYAAKQFDALADVQLVFVAPAMDWLAVDVLHYKVRPTFLRHAGIEKSGNIRMIERSQNFALLLEPGDDEGGISRGQDQFYGNLPVECFVGSFGKINGGHKTGPAPG